MGLTFSGGHGSASLKPNGIGKQSPICRGFPHPVKQVVCPICIITEAEYLDPSRSVYPKQILPTSWARLPKPWNMMADNKCTSFVTLEATKRDTLTTYIANDLVLCCPNGVSKLCLFSDQNNKIKTNTQAPRILLGQRRLQKYSSIISGGRKHLN